MIIIIWYKQKFVAVESFNTLFGYYLEHKHYISDILENLKVKSNNLRQFA